jgi:hypothetical protein
MTPHSYHFAVAREPFFTTTSSPSARNSSGDMRGNNSAAGWIGSVSRQHGEGFVLVLIAFSLAGFRLWMHERVSDSTTHHKM